MRTANFNLIYLCLLLFCSPLFLVTGDSDNEKGVLDKIKDKTKELTNSTKQAISSAAEKVTDTVNATKQSVSSSVESVKDTATAAKSIISSEDNSSVCYSDYDLGCFTNAGAWHTESRPFPLPQTPEDIDVKIYLYTRENTENRYTVTLRPNISIEESNYNSQRQYTSILTHGFGSDGNSSWITNLTEAYLKKRDANFFVVDWGKGASSINYLQVGANTRVVAAELIRFVKYLIREQELSATNVHLLGHSLGAQISAYVGKAIEGVRILTAFDPAQPGFEGEAAEVSLVKGDAAYVEIIHTNGRSFIPYLGFGYVNRSGNVDYYMNGGENQPGCSLGEQNETINGLSDLATFSTEVLSTWTTCAHSRSYEYYIEALSNDNCTFWGIPVETNSTMDENYILDHARSIIDRHKCTSTDKCIPLSLHDNENRLNGNVIVFTNAEHPYCVSTDYIPRAIEKLRESSQSTSTTSSSNSVKDGRYYERKFVLLIAPLLIFVYHVQGCNA